MPFANMSDEKAPTPATSPKPAGRLSWTQRVLIGCLVSPIVVLVLGIIVALVGYRVFSVRKQRALGKEIAAVRATDAPLTSA
jgi:hypothetical protein